MATALQIAQAVADITGFLRPTALINSDDNTARAMLRILNREGRKLANMRNTWNSGWSGVNVEYEFLTIPNVEEYVLPADYFAPIPGAFWNRSVFREARGTLSPAQWQLVRSGYVQSTTIAPFFRIRRSVLQPTRYAIFFDPIPGDTQDFVIEYIGKNWVMGSDGSRKASINRDTDVPVFDENLMEMALEWRFKQSRGLPYATELADFESERAQQLSADAAARPIYLAGEQTGRFEGNIPDTGFGIG